MSRTLPSQVVVRVDGREVAGTANSLGVFPRVTVPVGARVVVAVNLPDGDPGEAVAVAAQDSGRIEEVNAVAGVMHLDDERTVRFTAQLKPDRGTYRFTIRRGGEQRVVELWAGEELPLAMQ